MVDRSPGEVPPPRNGVARGPDSRAVSESGRTTEESTASGTPSGGTDEPAVRPAERTTYLRVRPSPHPRTTPAADARDTSAAGAPVQPVEAGEAPTVVVTDEPAGRPAAVAVGAEEPTTPEVEKAGEGEEPTEVRAVADDAGARATEAAEVQADAEDAGAQATEAAEVRADAPETEDVVTDPGAEVPGPPDAAEPAAPPEAEAAPIEAAPQAEGQPEVEEPDPAGAQPEATPVEAPRDAVPDEPSDLETTVELSRGEDTRPGPTPAPRPRPLRTVPAASGPSTKVLRPVAPPPAPATIPALPIAPVDPADRPFAHPQRSVPGKPDTLLRRLFRRRS